MSRSKRLAVLAGCSCLLFGCFKTNALVNVFNGGALDTSQGDPYEDPKVAATELVASRIRSEIGDGYFGQGSGAESQRPYVADWMDQTSKAPEQFRDRVLSVACADSTISAGTCKEGATAPAASDDSAPKTPNQLSVRQSAVNDLREQVSNWASTPTPTFDTSAPLCGDGKGQPIRHFADYVRFEAGVERAVQSVGRLLNEGLINREDIESGAKRAFAQSARYLRDRTWSRSTVQPTLGLVVKGGAATGVYSAGAVWTVLNIIAQCMRDPVCNKRTPDPRFKLLSGTSTGALVVTVVDRFNAVALDDHAKREEERARLAKWFTCSGAGDLYCVRSAPVFNLARDQNSLLDFDGLRSLLRKNVGCGLLTNSSELILNTVDFRSGRLFALSDQERFSIRTPEDVVQGALASAVLPVAARPVTRLPSNLDESRDQTYLDGGIRSEIPILPLARRGAERVLVVASASSIPVGTTPLNNAIDIAARYVDVSLAGVIENDLALAQSHIESVRQSESETCHDEIANKFAAACKKEQGCDADALCDGRWSQACRSIGAAELSSVPRVTPSLSERIQPVWQMVGIFRNEKRIEPLHGYTFEPAEQRRLFLAGAEEVRRNCTRIARLLGIRVDDDPGLRSRLVAWCAPALPEECTTKSQPIKSCEGEPLPPAPELTVACRPEGGPQ